MYLFLHRLRIFIMILVVAAIMGGVLTFINLRDYDERLARYNLQVTAAVATAIQKVVYDVTRTVEAPMNRYQVVQLGRAADLRLLAQDYRTTLELIQIVNSLQPDVIEGNGETLVVPIGVETLEPLRTIITYQTQPGDTLSVIARRNRVRLALLEMDNPVLAQRGIIPGDIVFIGLEL